MSNNSDGRGSYEQIIEFMTLETGRQLDASSHATFSFLPFFVCICFQSRAILITSPRTMVLHSAIINIVSPKITCERMAHDRAREI